MGKKGGRVDKALTKVALRVLLGKGGQDVQGAKTEKKLRELLESNQDKENPK